jgi:hypothetical protein
LLASVVSVAAWACSAVATVVAVVEVAV